MSHFENYEDTCRNYDRGRKAEGADIIIGLIKTHIKKDVKDLHILDAGCGTGNYSIALLQYGANKISMIDNSLGMMSQAKTKLDAMNLSNCVELKQAILPAIPYNDNTFDVVMINQVLHHLQKEPDGESFPSIMEFFAEAKRVLRPYGFLVITSTTKEQMLGIWYCNLNEACLERYSLNVPSAKCFLAMLNRAGFNVLNLISVLGHNVVPRYGELEGPFDKSFRVSFWGVFNDYELEKTLCFLRGLKENNTLGDFYKKHDKMNENGYFVIINAQIASCNGR